MHRKFFVLGLLFFPLLLWQAAPFAQEQAQQRKRKKAPQRANALVPSANAFLKTLDEAQTKIAVLDFDTEKRVQWHFIPKPSRKGVPLMDMSEQQKTAAMNLLRATLSKLGYKKAGKIMQLEGILRMLEGPGSEERRNPEKYYFTIFGQPKAGQRWGLSIEGHHLSLNFVMRGNRIIESTPQFFATNPAELKDDYGDGFPKGLRVLKEEEQIAFDLVNSLDEQQLAEAMLPGETPGEIRAAGEPQPPTEPAVGLAVAKMNSEQSDMLRKLLQAYTAKMKPPVSKARWEAIKKAGFDQVRFAWSGAKRPGIGHYYRVQGESFLVEFVNMQPDAAGNPANHVHCVWRDMDGDFDLPIGG